MVERKVTISVATMELLMVGMRVSLKDDDMAVRMAPEQVGLRDGELVDGLDAYEDASWVAMMACVMAYGKVAWLAAW